MLLHWEKFFAIRNAMPPFMGSNCIRNKRPEIFSHGQVCMAVQYITQDLAVLSNGSHDFRGVYVTCIYHY